MTLDELIARAKEASKNQCMNDLCRENFKQLAEWLEELKQYKEENQPEKSDTYQKQETNLDHYKDGILDCCTNNLAVVKGIPKSCSKTDCNDCDFLTIQKDCHEIAKEWLKQPYKKLTYKMTKFEVDLLQINSIKAFRFKNINVLTLMKEKGYFEGVDEDATIEDILANSEITEED